jgi:hypothetical protein
MKNSIIEIKIKLKDSTTDIIKKKKEGKTFELI